MADPSPLLSLLLLLLLLLLLFSLPTSTTQTPSLALLKWKSSLLQSHSLHSWTTNTNPCTWFGITCASNNRDRAFTVTKINLSNLSLSGTLHAFDFHSFPSLTHLNLSFNALHGPIPPTIAAMSSLLELGLYNNQFTNHIPPTIGNLTRLTVLYLDDNDLSGPIPIEIG
ncbi:BRASSINOSTEROID INSENSITIVE 1-associated receptor kinase 1 [Acorus calamus]|uniref:BRASSINOSTEROID INSENSITIVE 1-associated receptor kinase 1 n=1 Tax=Acorus calamus TaxID=4465 RepID=A0AAV9CM85_ACOCL|nr:BRASSINOSTEROID INSENSITIVE 1-associated receptor kinase 1 [Acorus calamus]